MTTTPNTNHSHVDGGDYYCTCADLCEMQDGVCARCLRYVAQKVNKANPCLHQHVTVYWRLYARATRYEPAEYIGKAQCSDCGYVMDPEDVDEDAEREDVNE